MEGEGRRGEGEEWHYRGRDSNVASNSTKRGEKARGESHVLCCACTHKRLHLLFKLNKLCTQLLNIVTNVVQCPAGKEGGVLVHM